MNYNRDTIAPTESAKEYAQRSEATYAYTLRDPENGEIVMRTDDSEVAQRYARALARQTLLRALVESEKNGRVGKLMRKILGR